MWSVLSSARVLVCNLIVLERVMTLGVRPVPTVRTPRPRSSPWTRCSHACTPTDSALLVVATDPGFHGPFGKRIDAFGGDGVCDDREPPQKR